jgi:hypothetical protein
VGEWAGSGESSAGKGRCRVCFELGLGGQFLVARSQAEITELAPDYLNEHMNASDEEIQRFARTGYESVEFYTLDQESGHVLGFLFDNLRCIATGRGKRDGFKEVIQWEWRNGYRSTRVTERLTPDRLTILEQTPQPDGTMMQDRVEMTRVKN